MKDDADDVRVAPVFPEEAFVDVFGGFDGGVVDGGDLGVGLEEGDEGKGVLVVLLDTPDDILAVCAEDVEVGGEDGVFVGGRYSGVDCVVMARVGVNHQTGSINLYPRWAS